jgi:polyisoprenoid-binding protein YceI
MRCARTVGLLLLVIGLAGVPRAVRAAEVQYRLDAGASRVVIHVGKAGLLGFAGHEHEVVAPALRGTVSADPDRLGHASVEVTFDAAALRVTGTGEPAGDVAQVQQTMLGPECLDAARFPTIHFVSSSVALTGDATPGKREVAIHGALTLHGVTRPITLRARVDVERDTIEASGALALRQTEFGIKPISKAGVVNVKDEVDLRWRLVGRRR